MGLLTCAEVQRDTVEQYYEQIMHFLNKRVQKSNNEIFIGKAGQKKSNCVLNKDSHLKMFHTTNEK